MTSKLLTCLLLIATIWPGVNIIAEVSPNAVDNADTAGHITSAKSVVPPHSTVNAKLEISPKNKSSKDPVRIAIAGLSHDHVNWIFRRENIGDIEIAGIYESNKTIWKRYMELYDLDPDLYFQDLDEMLDTVIPEAVTDFGSIFNHLAVVKAAASRGIHVMVEKPLAVNMDHALQMRELAEENGIHLITNYETTWYASNHAVFDNFNDDEKFGRIRKMVIHDGHMGPKEIGVSDEFLEWLTDPVLNGGGAIIDFGCYGANLATWLMQGEEPVSVTAIVRNYKPHIYEHVDDDATIILNYPEAQSVIQASWNWPYNRKDMHVYGERGYIYALNNSTIQVLERQRTPIRTYELEPRSYPFDDPFSYFAAVIRGKVEIDDNDLSSLKNNMTVVKILDAARKSAETGKTIYLDE